MNFMNKTTKGALLAVVLVILSACTLIQYTPKANAAGVFVHVRIVGATKTIWFGDVTTDGCSVTDTTNVVHTYAQPLAICALDAASKTGNFSYDVKDFGGSLGLFLQRVGTDTGASDFSTFWSYDLNGTSASQGISSQVVANNDSLYFFFTDPNADPNTRSINDGITYLRSQQQSNGQISGFSGVSGWAAISLAAAGVDPSTVVTNGTSLRSYLSNNPPTSSSSATDWERGILAITAMGDNPSAFNGTNYVQGLAGYVNNSQIGSATQINDDFFGLLALISEGSGASTVAKQDALNFIISHQGSDGGFSWSTTGTSDVDDTSAALLALVAAQKSGMSATGLATAITNAQSYILAAKNSDGGFASTKGDTSNASTTAWAIMALTANGVTGTNITNADAYLRGNQEENGSFEWQKGSAGDTFTSSYAVLALTGKYWPVKIFGGITPTVTPTNTPTPTPTSMPTPSPTIVTPTSTPVPSVTITPTVIPQTNHKGDSFAKILKVQHERLLKILEKQKHILESIQAQIQQECNHIFGQVFAFGKHR